MPDLVTYSAPEEIKPNERFRVWVNDKEIFVYNTTVNFNRKFHKYPKLGSTAFSFFDCSGNVKITIMPMKVKLRSVCIRPLSAQIENRIQDGKIIFNLDRPANLTFEINGDPKDTLHLFANPLEKDAPDPEDPAIIYYGPGVHRIGTKKLTSHQSVYLAGGAYLYGNFEIEDAENITIKGRGILDGSIYDRWDKAHGVIFGIHARKVRNLVVEDIIFLDPVAWTVRIMDGTDITISQIKIIGSRENSDGIDICSCVNSTIEGCFIRAWDDCVVIKGYDGKNTEHVRVSNCVLWTDLAQSLEIGFETRCPLISDVEFKDIVILHNFHKPILSIHIGDTALVENVRYENIIVEDNQMGFGDGWNYLIDLWIGKSIWTEGSVDGRIRKITYKNISLLDGKKPGVRIHGLGANNLIEDVTIEDLKVFGKKIGDLNELRAKINHYVDRVIVQ